MHWLPPLARCFPLAVCVTGSLLSISCSGNSDEPTAADILERSEQAMQTAGTVRVESLEWPLRSWQERGDQTVTEYTGDSFRILASKHYAASELCVTKPLHMPGFGTRGRGGLVIEGASQLGATAPDEIELLGDEVIAGDEVWVIRYRYKRASDEGPFPEEQTEWITKRSYLLVRRETESRDPWGFFGQRVEVFTGFGVPADTCPVDPTVSEVALRPLTLPRLEQ